MGAIAYRDVPCSSSHPVGSTAATRVDDHEGEATRMGADGRVELWPADFGLGRTPFTKAVAATKLFEHTAHTEVAHIRYCVAESAMAALTGDVGAGKTIALRAAAATLLAAEEAERHCRVLVAIDDAHLLEPAQLGGAPALDQLGDGCGLPLRPGAGDQPMLSRQLRVGTFTTLDHASPCATSSRAWTWPSPSPTCDTT